MCRAFPRARRDSITLSYNVNRERDSEGGRGNTRGGNPVGPTAQPSILYISLEDVFDDHAEETSFRADSHIAMAL
jgi:hypothetical protein